MTGRSAIREHVFALLFESLFNEDDRLGEQTEYYFEGLDKPVDDESMEYIRERFFQVKEKLPEIDALIEEKSTGWKIKRIGKVELSIMRLAVYEMLWDESVPEGVAINEAVELAKKYGQDHAGSFVNGVLAKFTEKKKETEENTGKQE